MLRGIAIAMLAVSVAAGCAPMGTTVKLSEINRPKLNTIYINEKIPVYDVYYFGPGVAPKYGDITFTKEVAIKRINQLVIENKLKIDEIIKQATADELAAVSKTVTNNVNDALSVMHLTVIRYGFSIPNGFSSKLVPVLILKADVVDQSGITIWSYQNSLSILESPVESVPALEILNSAENIRKSWTEGASAFAKMLVKEMQRTNQEVTKIE